MQGRGPRGAGAAPTRARPPVVGRPCDAGGGEPHARRGHDGDAVPRQARAHAEVEAVVDGRERGIESVERLPDGVPDEDGGRIEAEHVAESVVLALVQFVGDDRDAPPEARHGAAESGDPARLVPFHELRTRHRDGLGRLERGEQRVQRLGLRRGVLGEQPERVRVRRGRVEHPLARPHGLAEREWLLQRHDVGGAGGGALRAGLGVRLREHDHERVGCAHLRTDRVEGAPEMVAAVANDEDGGDSGEHRGQPKRPPARHPQPAGRAIETIRSPS